MSGIDASLREAMARGDARAAADLLRAKLTESPDPDTRLELARMLHLIDVEASKKELERAHDEFVQRGAMRRAAIAASRLGVYYMSGLGNRIAARAWFSRAWRLLDAEGPCLERGWVAIADIGCNANDPALLRERAEIALAMARQFGDVALEAKALADSGLALIETGELAEGFVRLDEAIALVTAGSVHDPISGTAQIPRIGLRRPLQPILSSQALFATRRNC